MTASRFALAFVLIASHMLGCAAPYYGHSKEEWTALTDEQKFEVKGKHAQIHKTRAEMRHDEQIERSKQRIIERGVRGLP